jgi:DNA-binding GntR family transcriptional regulator
MSAEDARATGTEDFSGRQLLRQPASDSVYQYLKGQIITGELKPGEKLMAQQVAEQLGTSPTPVREVLHRLASEGLVERSPFKGTMVARLSQRDLHDLYEVRLPLEELAVTFLATSATEKGTPRLEELVAKMDAAASSGDASGRILWAKEFHVTLYKELDNPHLRDTLLFLRDKSSRYINILRAAFSEPVGSAKIHRDILDAIRRGDARAARAAVRKDLVQTVAAMEQCARKGVIPVE